MINSGLNKKIAGVITLYHPPKDIIDNIKLFLPGISMLIVFDNSEIDNRALLNQIRELDPEKIEYYWFQENLGLAAALNFAAKKALDSNYEWLLAMDHDSRFRQGDFKKMTDYLGGLEEDNIGIVVPWQQTKHEPLPQSINEIEAEQILSCMTSGSLINLKVYRKNGGFSEDYFLDYVDHEYCIRLNLNGYKVIRFNKATLVHDLGEITRHFKYLTTNHSPIRRYYIVRNRLYLMIKCRKDFFDFYRICRRALLREFAFVVLFERKKIKKIFYMLRGIIDFFRKKTGKITYKRSK